MPKPTRIPTYRLHKPSGLAIVAIRGRMFYLGRYGSTESRAEYSRILAEWTTLGSGVAPVVERQNAAESLTVGELVLSYWRFCQGYYVKDGKATAEVNTTHQALKPVVRLYGHARAKDFGPLALKACRDAMVTLDWSRGFINAQ